MSNRVEPGPPQPSNDPRVVMSTYTVFWTRLSLDERKQFYVGRHDILHSQTESQRGGFYGPYRSLEAVRDAIPPNAGMCFHRDPNDDPTIVETWM